MTGYLSFTTFIQLKNIAFELFFSFCTYILVFTSKQQPKCMNIDFVVWEQGVFRNTRISNIRFYGNGHKNMTTRSENWLKMSTLTPIYMYFQNWWKTVLPKITFGKGGPPYIKKIYIYLLLKVIGSIPSFRTLHT